MCRTDSDAKLRSEMVMVVMFAGWYDVDRMLMLMMLMTNEGGGEESPLPSATTRVCLAYLLRVVLDLTSVFKYLQRTWRLQAVYAP